MYSVILNTLERSLAYLVNLLWVISMGFDMERRAKEIGRAMNVFLESISQESRVIFLRRYWYVDTIAEIAVRYGISESAVQMRLIRTRSKLAEYLAKEGINV